MKSQTAVFFKYVCVGLLNTLIHWLAFFLMFYGLSQSQSFSNGVAFCIAVTASFYINSRWTFQKQATGGRYIAFVAFMGLLAVGIGAASDAAGLNPFVTLILFSGVSLVVGFLYSKFIVFSDRAS